MQALAVGTRIATEFGREIRVLQHIGEGGQGAVYKVAYGGETKALKWYFPDSLRNRDKFIANLRHNIMAGSPTKEFLWPLDLTDIVGGSFGYVMDLRPEGFYEAGDILLDPSLLPSFKRAVDACLNIVSAFRVLHNSGYRYQDINGGNFFINPTTGKVLICDNDNVAPEGTETGIIGYPGFMAPEIVMGQSMPTVKSDLHSLGVLIFYLLVLQHPLEGVRARRRDEDSNRELYGSNPVFIFDEQDRSNMAIPSEKNNALRIWPCLPRHMQDLFRRAFSHDALHNPNRRPSEIEWMRELTKFRSEIVRCHCGNEVFLQGTAPRRCESCGAVVGSRLRLELVNVSGNVTPLVPVLDDARLYTCQLRSACNVNEALDPLLWVLASKKNPQELGLRNISKRPWEMMVGERTLQVEPGQTVRAAEGLSLRMDGIRKGETIRVARNVR